MPKRKKTCNCEHPKAKTVVHGYGKFACYLKPEPNPRKRPDKTDAELFVEWEEYNSKRGIRVELVFDPKTQTLVPCPQCTSK